MLILDTDHLVEYQKGTSPAAQQLKQRLDEAEERFSTTIVTFENDECPFLRCSRRALTSLDHPISPMQSQCVRS
jgi:hypothetical protein